ncbi:hypothetical protein EDD65_10630 [Keratinibaculum paraultunense]|uniref:Uncharacterized protein n=1 Tax=Keratinibaculum paraultunense TaxID=1278232 RepID=A0A4R3KXV8_9FIRM|nr:hypothetical protein [Keratinibaculum paraultunense]QQY79234.1 hypothetical protein JL105_08555 [Keratinibaculum paraultunense]TCS89364.1 hypothetical protein EDD65_10630 [Keratinibaculum paraultunense]
MGEGISNEQLFEFMTKMYGEMQEGFKEVKQDIVRLENKMDVNHKALYDGYKLTYEKLITLEEKVDKIENKVEKQDVEIRVIKGAK